MPGLDPSIVKDFLPLDTENFPPKRQHLRRQRAGLLLRIKEEKKDGRVRVCVDYRDLNKTSPKDNFPLPHIDVLDKIKTTFITMWGTFCYKVMLFCLKNAGATYQRAMVMLFHNMMHKEIEVYVNDMIANKHAAIEWDDECQKTFDDIKVYLVQPPQKSDFPCTNNVAEYEACILGLQAAIDFKTKDAKLVPYHEYLEELAENFEKISFTYTSRIKNQFADALATLASMLSITKENLIEPLEIEIAKGPAHCDAIEATDEQPWYEDIKIFLRIGQYLAFANRRDRKTLQRLTAHYFLSGETLYRRSFNATLLRHYHLCQVYADQIKAPPMSYTRWQPRGPFQCGGIDVICPINPNASNGYLFILVAIDYFTKWIEAMTLTSITTNAVARFLKRDIIARYGVLETIITDNAKNLNNKIIDELSFNARVRHREFCPGDLVLRKVLHIAPDSRGKFAYKYDGPFVVKEVFSGGAIILSDMDETENALPVNADALKKYYP
ncbi:hypothetical protein CRG98_013786 [Punica granatum]|uniref:Integrase catalytic domain-containing protein n=1 Tax=Punica granatum TaxID=22663 RepID=A0A2I0KBE8_PUNGR|nr:hypothetical protein CRG98_013786 [Punica granatum]